MKIIGEKLSKQEMLNVKGGASCFQCTCGGGQMGTWLSSTTARQSDWDTYCGEGNEDTCDTVDHPDCPTSHQ